MAATDKVRIIMVGDSGVGKTSLAFLISHNDALTSPGWTVGCGVEVKLHEYKEGTPAQRTYFIELWDIGGSISHKNTRSVFYNPVHGIILVHDLTNRKSQENLQEWIMEILNKEGKDVGKGGGGTMGGNSTTPSLTSGFGLSTSNTSTELDFDPEQFLGSTQIPILVIGTKSDLIDDAQRTKQQQRTGNIADQCGADEICLNCHDSRSLAPGTTDSVKLGRFFDKVIERKYYTRENSIYASGGVGGVGVGPGIKSGSETRRYTSTPYTSPFTTPFNSPLI